MSVKDILIKAKSILEENGWCQNRYNGSNGEVCLSEAIQRAGGHQEYGSFYMPPDSEVLMAHRYISSNILEDSVYGWNDRKGRTKEEVMAALDKAIMRREKYFGE